MSLALNEWLPPDAVNILLVLFLSFLIGLEREERKAAAERYAFGGVRTFPLIGLMAYAIAFLSGGTALAELVGTRSRSEEHTSELQSHLNLVCRLLNDTPTTEIYTLSLHDALPISFPLIGLMAYAIAFLSGGTALAELVGTRS